MAAGRRTNASVAIIAILLALQLSSQESSAESTPLRSSQQHGDPGGISDVPSASDRPTNSSNISSPNVQAAQLQPSLLFDSTNAADRQHAAEISASAGTPATAVQPLSSSAALHLQLEWSSVNQSAAATDAAPATAASRTTTCSQRPAFRLFVPAAAQSNQRYLWLVMQLVKPSVAVQLWQLFTAPTCGAASTPCLIAAPPAAVVQNTLETSESDGIARVQVSLSASGAQTLTLILQADACNPIGTAANFTVDVVTGSPQGVLHLVTSPNLTNSSFQATADFNHPIASFDLSKFMLSNMSGISSILRTTDDSFTLFADGIAGTTVEMQMEAGSFQDTTNSSNINDTNVILVHAPALQEIMTAFSITAQKILPYALGLSGMACGLAVAAIPGTPLAICAPPLIRTLGHLQILAASTGISRTPYEGSFPNSYAVAVAELSWALLDWFPMQPLLVLKSNWLQLVVTYVQPDNITWSAAPADGSKLDSWLFEIQNTSAMINAYDICSDTTQQQQLQQLKLATRAAFPQLPLVIDVTPNTWGLAVIVWSGLASAGQVTVVLLILAVVIHAVIAATGGNWSGAGGQQSDSVTYRVPGSVQFPLLVLMVVLLTLPALLYWVGCLAAAKQQFWMVFGGIFSTCAIAGACHIWMLQHVLGTTQVALLGARLGTSSTGSGPGRAHLLRIDQAYDRAKQFFHRQQQQQTPVVSLVQQQQQQQQRDLGDAAAVRYTDERSQGGQRIYRQQQQQQHQDFEDAAAVRYTDERSQGGQRIYRQQQQQQEFGDAAAVARHTDEQSQGGQRIYRQQQQQRGGNPLGEAAAGADTPATVDDGDSHAAASSAGNGGSNSGSGSLIEAVTSTLNDYQQRLQQFRHAAMLSISGRSRSLQQQQQHQLVEAVQGDPPAVVPPVDLEELQQGQYEQQQQQCKQRQRQQEQSASEQASDEALGSSSSGSGSSSSDGESGARAVGEGRERLLPNSTIDEDVERLQQEEVLREIREARRRAKVRKQLRQQRIRPDALIEPRPLPPDPPELTDYGRSPPGDADEAYDAEGVEVYGAAATAFATDPRQAAALAARPQNPYDAWQLQQAQDGRSPRKPDGRFAAVNRSKIPTAAAGGRNSAAGTSVAVEHESWFPRLLASIGLLHSVVGPLQVTNPLMQQRLQYMARYGVLLWDVTGPVGSTDPGSEAKLLAGVSQSRLLVANVMFASLASACCILYGSIGPLGSFEPQIWVTTFLQIAWLVYVGGFNPFCEIIITAIEGLLGTGHILIVICALWGIVQGESNTLRLVALCSLSGMVFFMAIVECIRAFMLVVSMLYAMKRGSRRRRRVAPAF